MSKQEYKSQVFHLSRNESKAHCLGFIGNLPVDGSLEVEVRSAFETRNDLQNRLMWHWNHEVSKQLNISSKFAHGQSKYEVLHPLTFQWGAENKTIMERAHFLATVFEKIPDWGTRIGVAFDMVRSRGLSVNRFSEYLNNKEIYWAERGVLLTNSDDLYFNAMGIKH